VTGRERRSNQPLEKVANVLARACGHVGSGAEYLYNTVSHLEEFGIHDRNLWRFAKTGRRRDQVDPWRRSLVRLFVPRCNHDKIIT